VFTGGGIRLGRWEPGIVRYYYYGSASGQIRRNHQSPMY